MQIEAYIPTAALRPFILKYLVVESVDELTNRVLPDTSVVMVFRYKGTVSYLTGDSKMNVPSAAVSGLRRSVRLINYTSGTGNILVMFREACAAAFFNEPLHELFNESISLDNFAGPKNTSIIEAQLSEAKNNDEKIKLIEQFLLTRMRPHEPDKPILNAIENIKAMKGIVRIKDLAASFYISQDVFEKRFRKVVGTTPKQYAYTVRLRSIIEVGLRQSFIQTALNAGYYDQAHFNKDFKQFTGQTPTDFFKPIL